MVHHFLRTNSYKMSIFERSVTCSFFQELYSHIEKNSGEKFEEIFLVKIANKGTSLSVHTNKHVTDKLQVAGVMKNKLRVQRAYPTAPLLIKLILLLFCSSQRLSLSCDTQKREGVVTGLNSKDLICMLGLRNNLVCK